MLVDVMMIHDTHSNNDVIFITQLATLTNQPKFSEKSGTLSPIIMEVKNHPKCKETSIGGTHFPLP